MYNSGLNREFNMKTVHLIYKLNDQGSDLFMQTTSQIDADLFIQMQGTPTDWYVAPLEVDEKIYNTTPQLWVVYFESSNYCGYGERCMVWALDEEDASNKATDYAEDFYCVQDEEQYIEEHGEDTNDVVWAEIKTVDALDSDECADIQKWLLDDTQRGFYPIVN